MKRASKRIIFGSIFLVIILCSIVLISNLNKEKENKNTIDEKIEQLNKQIELSSYGWETREDVMAAKLYYITNYNKIIKGGDDK